MVEHCRRSGDTGDTGQGATTLMFATEEDVDCLREMKELSSHRSHLHR